MTKIAFITSTGLRFREHLSNATIKNVMTEYGEVPIVIGNLLN